MIVSLWKIMAMDQGNFKFQIRGSLEDLGKYRIYELRYGYAWIKSLQVVSEPTLVEPLNFDFNQ